MTENSGIFHSDQQDAITRAATLSVNTMIEAGAALMLEQPWRILRAMNRRGDWPPDEALSRVLDTCQAMVRAQTELGRRGHWAFDANRLIALRQAQRALEQMTVNQGGPDHCAT